MPDGGCALSGLRANVGRASEAPPAIFLLQPHRIDMPDGVGILLNGSVG